MSFQHSQTTPVPLDEQPTQRFRRRNQHNAEIHYCFIFRDAHNVEIVYWSSIMEAYERDGKVQYVVDGNVLLEKLTEDDWRIIVPERIRAYPGKILEVVFEGDRLGGPEDEAPHDDDHQVKNTVDHSNPGLSMSPSMSKPPVPRQFSASPPIMVDYTQQYFARTASSSSLSPSPSSSPPLSSFPSLPPAEVSRRMLTVSSEAKAHSPLSFLFTCSTMLLHFCTHSFVAQNKATFPSDPSRPFRKQREMGEADDGPRRRDQVCVDPSSSTKKQARQAREELRFIQMFVCPSTVLRERREPTAAPVFMSSVLSLPDDPNHYAKRNDYHWTSHCDDGHPRNEEGSTQPPDRLSSFVSSDLSSYKHACHVVHEWF